MEGNNLTKELAKQTGYVNIYVVRNFGLQRKISIKVNKF